MKQIRDRRKRRHKTSPLSGLAFLKPREHTPEMSAVEFGNSVIINMPIDFT